VHTVVGKDPDLNITIINTAFRKETLTYFKERYFTDCRRFFFSDDPVPFHIQIDKFRLGKLVQWADYVHKLPRTNRTLDPYLLKICNLEDQHFALNYPEELPQWLLFALNQYREPVHFAKGIRGFVELAGRSPEHIHRILRKYLNKTLSETVNLARIQYAARQLIMTDQKILVISLESNFQSLSYFYKCFKKEYNISPDQYRKRYRSII
jgi:AraC family cel operon transcriptional repressor